MVYTVNTSLPYRQFFSILNLSWQIAGTGTSTMHKSQLDLYLESLDPGQNTQEVSGSSHEPSQFENASLAYLTSTGATVVTSTLNSLLRGSLIDASWVSALTSPYTGTSVHIRASEVHDALRRAIVLLVLLCTAPGWPAYYDYELDSLFGRLLVQGLAVSWRHAWSVQVFLLLIYPMVAGCCHAWLLQQLQVASKLSQQRTGRLISVIKRVQLVYMGGMLSHPMPPVAKLESKWVDCARSDGTNSRNYYHNDMLSAKEMRSDLCAAMTALQSHINEDPSLGSYEAQNVPSLLELNQLQHELFEVRLPAAIATLDTLNNKSISAITTEDATLVDNLLTICASHLRAVYGQVRKLWWAYTLWSQLKCYVQRCDAIAGPFTLALDDAGALGDAVTPHSSVTQPAEEHSYSESYCGLRRKLGRMRNAYEQITLQLCLAEAQLARTEVVQLSVVSDHAVQHSDPMALSQQAQCTRQAGTLLCGGGASCDATTVSIEEALTELESSLLTLPTVAEFAELLQHMHELADCLATATSPAERRRMAVETTSMEPSGGNRLESQLSSAKAPTVDCLRSAEGADGSAGEFGDKIEDSASSPLDSAVPIQEGGAVIDVYTTVVPRVAVEGRRTTPAEALNGSGERSTARSVLKELHQHLRLLRAPVGSSACAGGGAAVRMERVRELVPTVVDGSGMREAGDTVVVRVHSELVQEELPVESTPSKAPTLVRMGTLLLTPEEAAGLGVQGGGGSLQATEVHANFASEMSLAPGENGIVSEFARAMHARRVEASLGDLSD
jgi:hypothetical protein